MWELDKDEIKNIKEYYKGKDGILLVEGEKNIKLAKKRLKLIKEYFSFETEKNYRISEKVMERITGNKFIDHIALFEIPTDNDFSSEENIIILDNILDFGNIGSIIRSGNSFGFTKFIYYGSLNYWNHKTIEASRGLIFKTPLIRKSLSEIEEIAKNKELILTTPSTDGSISLKTKNQIIVFGNETNGISQEFYNLFHRTYNIPVQFESLNVSVAAGIILYEYSKLE